MAQEPFSGVSYCFIHARGRTLRSTGPCIARAQVIALPNIPACTSRRVLWSAPRVAIAFFLACVRCTSLLRYCQRSQRWCLCAQHWSESQYPCASSGIHHRRFALRRLLYSGIIALTGRSRGTREQAPSHLPFLQAARPATEAVLLVADAVEYRARAHNQQTSQVAPESASEQCRRLKIYN